MTAPLLAAENLSLSFGGLRAVDGVNLRIVPGEIRALIGPNGAGKTSLVSLFSGRLKPSAGKVIWQGRDITGLPAHARVRLGLAYTFQVTSIFPRLSVGENVALALDGMPARRLAARVEEVLARVGLGGRAGTLAGSLPYGHQRLVELAMGLALAPKLLMLDEPTQGLSDGEISTFLDVVRGVAKTATVLLIEHNMEVVMALATRITVLERGRVLAEGPPEAIRTNEAVQRAYLGVPAGG